MSGGSNRASRSDRRSSCDFSYKPLRVVLRELSTRETFFDIYSLVWSIFSNGHAYYSEWNELDIDVDFCQGIVSTIMNQEECGQLKGIGLWLLEMMVSHCKTGVCIDILTEDHVLTKILTIFIKQSTHDRCLNLLIACIERGKLKFTDIYTRSKSNQSILLTYIVNN